MRGARLERGVSRLDAGLEADGDVPAVCHSAQSKCARPCRLREMLRAVASKAVNGATCDVAACGFVHGRRAQLGVFARPHARDPGTMTASSSASRLFHTIVVVGISLGASAGCGGLAAGPDDAPANASSSGSSGAAARADAAPPDAIAAAFCDVPWPTTKGNNTVLTTPLPPCVDPSAACADERIDTVGPCLAVETDGCLDDPAAFFYPNCRGGAWVCPPSTASSNATPRGACSCAEQFRGGARCVGGTWVPSP